VVHWLRYGFKLSIGFYGAYKFHLGNRAALGDRAASAGSGFAFAAA
jgi:hypothetical protein